MDVLLVEDSDEVRLITVEFLAELGHETLAVAAAESALEALGTRRFDAVITDVSLPGMSGIELAKELVRRHPRLPVIISSGYGTLSVEQIVGSPQPSVFLLTKPYDIPTLQRTLEEAAALGGEAS